MSKIPAAPYPPLQSAPSPLSAPPTLPEGTFTTASGKIVGISSSNIGRSPTYLNSNVSSSSINSSVNNSNNINIGSSSSGGGDGSGDWNTNNPARLQFSPEHRDIYACVNCQSHSHFHYPSSNNNSNNNSNINSNQNSNNGFKVPLLEIRQFRKILDPQTGYYSYTSRLLAESRNEIGLNRIVSTCIAFRPSSPHLDNMTNNDTIDDTIHVATGLSNGCLCLHIFPNLTQMIQQHNDDNEHNLPQPIQHPSFLRYYNPSRQSRTSTCVEWASTSPSTQRSSQSLVAIGLQPKSYSRRSSFDREACCLVWDLEHSMDGTGTGIGTSLSASLAGGVGLNSINSTTSITSGGGGGGNNNFVAGGMSSVRSVSSFISSSPLDISGSSILSSSLPSAMAGGAGNFTTTTPPTPPPPISTTTTSTTTGTTTSSGIVSSNKGPIYKFAHHSGVSSLAWLPYLSTISGPGQTLLVGCQSRQIQLYDLRRSSTSHAPPKSFVAHSEEVNGIKVNPHRPYIFASFSNHDKSQTSTIGGSVPVTAAGVGSSSSAEWNTHTHAHTQNQFGSAGPVGSSASATTTPGTIVKLWDARMLKDNNNNSGHGSNGLAELKVGEIKIGGNVSDISWSPIWHGTLAVATGDSIRYFDTVTSTVRPVLTRVTHCREPIQCIDFQPIYSSPSNRTIAASSSSSSSPLVDDRNENGNVDAATEIYEKNTMNETNHDITEQRSKNNNLQWGQKKKEVPRILAVSNRGKIYDLPTLQVAPLSISSRDGSIAHSSGGSIWIGSAANAVCSRENFDCHKREDISATMMRRARCLHAARYSTDAAANLQILSEEESEFHDDDILPNDLNSMDREDESFSFSTHKALWRLWSWIERVEMLSNERLDEGLNINNPPPPSNSYASSAPSKPGTNNKSSNIDERLWKVNGLIYAGSARLLKMETTNEDTDENHIMDMTTYSETLGCDTYDSPLRSSALIACGWVSRFGLQSILADCEARDHFERSAALAVFHGELGSAFTALQRGANALRDAIEEEKGSKDPSELAASFRYVETLQLVAMCIAGYSVSNKGGQSRNTVWCHSCEDLLLRPDLSVENKLGDVPYLRAACIFLCNVSKQGENWYEDTLQDRNLSLSDRVAFACRFLPRKALRFFLDTCIQNCMNEGNVEGIVITGLGKRGIDLLQTYVDRYSDVQTVALVSSRVILPSTWVRERAVCSEWLESYRNLLNTWQMWQSRAMFDVGRADLLRHLIKRQQLEKERYAANSTNSRSSSSNYSTTRRIGTNSMKKQQPRSGDMNRFAQNFPPQVYARCNFCNTPLPLNKLRRQEGMANSWLSRQKPVLSCCPQCRKPLPRCCVCLLPLGCLNPYLELKRERNKASRAALYGNTATNSSSNINTGLGDDDLSGLTDLPFAEWWVWCMRCKHGGHAHHLVGWFGNHDTCPVSSCDCRCQFDGIQKLSRPVTENK